MNVLVDLLIGLLDCLSYSGLIVERWSLEKTGTFKYSKTERGSFQMLRCVVEGVATRSPEYGLVHTG